MSFRFFREASGALPAMRDLRRTVQEGISPVSVAGVSHIHRAQLTAALSADTPLVVILPDDAAARQLCEDVNFITGRRTAYPYPAKELNFLDAAGISREYEQIRISALTAWVRGDCRVLAASAEAAMQFTVPENILRENLLTFRIGGTVDIKQLTETLVRLGYVRQDQVDAPCQFSVRGDIVDIFSPQNLLPFRMELWGDEIDSLAWFEPETQRRSDTLEEVVVAPAVECLPDSEKLAGALEELANHQRGKTADTVKNQMRTDAQKLREGLRLQNIDLYFPVLYDKPATLFDYCPGTVILHETGAIIKALEGVQGRELEETRGYMEAGVMCQQLSEYFLPMNTVLAETKKRTLICMNAFFAGANIFSYRMRFTVEALQNAPWGGSTVALTEQLRDLTAQHYRILVCGGTEKTLPLLQKDLEDSGFTAVIAGENTEPVPGMVLLVKSGLSAGFEYPETRYACIAQGKAQSTVLKKRKFKKGLEIKALSEIAEGDLVVHAGHGIGRFTGVKKLESNGIVKDYISIQYAGGDMLFVPVTQLDLVSRYIGGKEDNTVKLNKLGSNEWQKTRNNVKKAVRDMAAELIKLYALREKAEGFAFDPDDDTQRDFEARFPYVETEDQLRSIAEIKQDMERSRPMERLLCGDVGFGKTEVAFRAALKCILSGKQCALLAPTTVLANQHYETALRRFESVPVNIELLSRYRSKKKQTEILKKIENGTIDLIIGTHRLLSKDVKFGALGLAIIDEEQRFGVAHKEKFKTVFHGVDMLTLSATPIPRTLNMALSGIRDMSVLEEPPQDRYPVQSFVMEYNEPILVQAIQRELKRGGQVYYIHNRVGTIQHCAARLQMLIPNARVGFAHGQMDEQQISEIWRQLVEQEIDILVCTTIIETGVDVPNVNTLIVEQADRFGLAQLYQLRGRVGRSSRRAFAYFTYKQNTSITEIAQRRLDAMREFTQFGSGFRIAMRDLEIRGAGSILGGQQHGQMEQVGYEMYLKMLNEAIAEEKGEPKPPEASVMEIQTPAYIPEEYIPGLTSRLEIYRRIALVRTEQDKNDMLDELIDRFGDPPKSLVSLIDISLCRNRAGTLGITEIRQKNNAVYFYITDAGDRQIRALMLAFEARLGLSFRDQPYYFTVRITPEQPAMELVLQVLEIFGQNQ